MLQDVVVQFNPPCLVPWALLGWGCHPILGYPKLTCPNHVCNCYCPMRCLDVPDTTLTSQRITSPGCWHQGSPAPSPAPSQAVQHPRYPLGNLQKSTGHAATVLVFPLFSGHSAKFITTTHSKIYGNFQAHVGCSSQGAQARPGPWLHLPLSTSTSDGGRDLSRGGKGNFW